VCQINEVPPLQTKRRGKTKKRKEKSQGQ